METSRRTFLKTASAVPAAAVIATLPAMAASAAAPAAVAVADKYPFQWWHSYDGGEYFSQCFGSKAEALDFLAKEGGMVAECQRSDFDLTIHGDDLLETLYGQNEEQMGEDGDFIVYTQEQANELGKMVSAAIQAWVVKHKIDVQAHIFGAVRNEIIAPKEKPAALKNS